MRTDWKALCAELANTLERAQKALRFEGGCSDATDSKRRALIDRARAALAEPEPAPLPVGEVAELVAWLRDAAFDLNGSDPAKSMLTRAADLLEQRHPAPVPVASDIYFEFVISDADYCTQAGGIAPTYAQAISEGQHYLAQYLQDGPHTLELRRVEVLNPDALPLPQGEPQP